MLLVAGCTAIHESLPGKGMANTLEIDAISRIEKLQARYFELADLMENQVAGRPGAEEMVDELFTDTSEWILYSVAGDRVFRGREELLNFVAWLESFPAESHSFKHFGLNSQVALAANTATSKVQLLILITNRSKDESMWSIGHYHNSFQRDSQGNWKFTSIKLRMEDTTVWSLNGIGEG